MCVFANRGDEVAVIEDEAYEHEDGDEGCETSWWDFKVWANGW